METKIIDSNSASPPLSPYDGISSLFTPPASDIGSEGYMTASDLDIKRKSSIAIGNEISHLIETDRAKNAIRLLREAMDDLNLGQEDPQELSAIYSKVLTSLCDTKMTILIHDDPDIYHSILWRLFTKVIESGYTLQRDAHINFVNYLVDCGHMSVALQAMYTLPRTEWDTECYRIAVLLHLMQRPEQIQEAEGLLSDFGKPYLEMANPNDPDDLPPVRIDMPLMKQVTQRDKEQLWMLYQVAASSNKEWDRRKSLYENQRREYVQKLKERRRSMSYMIQDWAVEQLLHMESEREQVDRASTQNDNAMIYSAMIHRQFEYAWHVYQAMGNAVDEITPCLVMHLCWVAFSQIPQVKVSQRLEWESRAWSVYSRFMCSEYLHPEATETPSFLHDLLLIAAYSAESKARLTKVMSIYHLLTRLDLRVLLCDERVLEPMLCTLIYECSREPVEKMSQLAFEMWQRKWQSDPSMSLSVLWGLVLLCVKTGDKDKFRQLVDKLSSDTIVPSVMAPIQHFHDIHLCSQGCYFENYMFQAIKYTDRTIISYMDIYGLDQQRQTTINEPQAIHITMAVLHGLVESDLSQKEMYYSTKKAKAILRHCFLTSQITL
ncbi:hypothetical protein RMCBS344292_17676 [Rhizopus microsporus]|nr:hypothetical protein RMCBS344292_17676 [Rhizopus microsporus]